ncbi:hypothetical protein [Brucella anthropi]|uniref:hypothetical protein n=1 Tax=Brucella anthropi TaxID=529 RepID=UPI00124EB3FF|nr:hypothetical protein [Brucella anthropi]KAB2783719.1 hypothetical protein F9K99_04120 [Brucella anthropi]
MASELKPCLSAFVKWTKQHHAHWNLSPIYINGQFSKFMDPDTDTAWMGFEAAWNTRPAPAATDTELATVGYMVSHDAELGPVEDAVVYRSQAEGLLAAKDDHIKWLKNNLEAAEGRARNAAANSVQFEDLLAAEVKLKQHWKDEAERFRIEFEKAAYDYLLTKARTERAEADVASTFDTCLALNSRIEDLEAELATAKLDGNLLDALQHQSWDLHCFDIPTGGDDADIGWRIVGHWQAKPHERTIAEVYNDDPRAAIRAAIEVKS